MKFLNQAFTTAAVLSPFLVALSVQPSLAVDPECRNLNLPTTITGENQINGGDGCYKTPDSYIVKAYKLGLCPVGSNPLSSTTFDPSACSVIWEDSSGEEANLVDSDGNAESFTLDSTNATKPPNGDYGFAFVVIDPTIKLKASIVLDGETWVTTTDYESTDVNPLNNTQYSWGANSGSAELAEIRTGYLETSAGNACYTDGIVVDNKTIHAAFVDSDENTVVSIQQLSANDGGTTNSSCEASFIVGVQELNTPITITDETSTADLSFLTTNNGAWLETYEFNGTPRVQFDVGPFSLEMSVQ